MCLILFSYQQHPRYPLIMAANRDEYYARASAAAHFWEDAPGLLAGRDLQAGGTWLGVSHNGRVAAITNYREGNHTIPDAPSRGDLVRDFLLDNNAGAVHFAAALEAKGQAYNGFNLLLKDDKDFVYYSNRSGQPAHLLGEGLFGLSNHLLDTPWPKVTYGRKHLATLISRYGDTDDKTLSQALLTMLADRYLPDEDSLPDTGVGLERERVLAPMFIESDSYGTRSTAILLIDRSGRVSLTEKIYIDDSTRHFSFQISDFA